MLRFISSLFSSADRQSGSLDPALVEKAINRVVDATDSRLRGFGNYRKRLRPSVEQAIAHIQQLVSQLPSATEISRQCFRADERLRAFFVSSKDMQKTLSGCKALKDYIHEHGGNTPAEVFGTLSMSLQEKNILGMALSNDNVQRDVAQVQVSFTDHRFVGPADAELEARHNLELRGFDFLTEKILESIVHDRLRRNELEQHYRILARKLETLRAGNWGLSPMLAEEEISHPDHAALESEIAALDTELQRLGCRSDDLKKSLDTISTIMTRAGTSLSVGEIELRLDKSLTRKVTSTAAKDTHCLKLVEASASSGERRILLFGRIPSAELAVSNRRL